MKKRQLVTKPMRRAAREAVNNVATDFNPPTDAELDIIIDTAAPLIAAKALNDFADYFKETGIMIGMDPKVATAVENIARRYAKDWI